MSAISSCPSQECSALPGVQRESTFHDFSGSELPAICWLILPWEEERGQLHKPHGLPHPGSGAVFWVCTANRLADGLAGEIPGVILAAKPGGGT